MNIACKIHETPDVYRIPIDLPGNPLRSVNVYVIQDGGEALVIDTGFNMPKCYEMLVSGLEELSLDPAHTDLFLTHSHADHTGLVGKLTDRFRDVYIDPYDYGQISTVMSGSWWEKKEYCLWASGFTGEDIARMKSENPITNYSVDVPFEFIPATDDQLLWVGKYQLRCIYTPGHTQGHLCLYEPSAKLLFSGDHVLFDISPNIVSWYDELQSDALGAYLESLKKVRDIECSLVFPGHREPSDRLKERVDELLTHHDLRLKECEEALHEFEEATCVNIASRITWHIKGSGWDEYPVSQKMFAEGETRAHLMHLVARERASIVKREGVEYYRAKRARESSTTFAADRPEIVSVGVARG